MLLVISIVSVVFRVRSATPNPDEASSVDSQVDLQKSSWRVPPTTETLSAHAEIDSSSPDMMNGMTINAWSAEAYNSSDFDLSITNLAGISANWVTFTVFWFMNTSSDTEMRPRPDLYSASDSSLTHAVQKARELGMKVSLKPMVDVVDGTWRGQISPSNWTLWFKNYRNFTNYYADFASANNVELFTVGTELRSSQSYESEWRQVTSEVRTRFSGNVTYAANWDSYGIYSRLPQYAVKFWDALDYVGVDAYFPLTNIYDPAIQQLVGNWSHSTASGWWGTGFNWTNELYSTSVQTGKKIVFTEIGYTSQNGTNTQPWTWNVSPTLDLQEQADCYQACLEVFKDKTWFMGWFWWDWETNPNAGGPTDKDYTPQNKPAQSILNEYYSTRTVTFQAAGTGAAVTVNYTRTTGGYTARDSLTVPVSGSNSTTVPYGSTVSFSYESSVSGGSKIRYVLVSANASSPLTNIVNDTTVMGNYKTQHLLTALTAPLGLSPQPTRNPAGEAGPTSGWWYDASVGVALAAQMVIGYTFGYWDVDGGSQGGGVNPVTVTMNAAHTATAHYTGTNVHDIALTNITLSKNLIGRGFSLNFTVAVENQGDYIETFNVTVYANTTVIGAAANVILTIGNSKTIAFAWNTIGFAKGNYTIWATASIVQDETDVSDNTFTNGIAKVTVPGDVSGDFMCDMQDISIIIDKFMARPSDSTWSAECDVNCDGVIDMLDISIAIDNFMVVDP